MKIIGYGIVTSSGEKVRTGTTWRNSAKIYKSAKIAQAIINKHSNKYKDAKVIELWIYESDLTE